MNNSDAMMKCLYCNSINHPADISIDYTLNGPVERCPNCDSDELVEVVPCSQCTNYDIPDEMDTDGLCKECAGEKEIEVEFVITVSISYKGKFPYKAIRDYKPEEEGNPLATKEIHEEVRKQVAKGNYCITNYTWEEV